jgi:hypothetical protein
METEQDGAKSAPLNTQVRLSNLYHKALDRADQAVLNSDWEAAMDWLAVASEAGRQCADIVGAPIIPTSSLEANNG